LFLFLWCAKKGMRKIFYEESLNFGKHFWCFGTFFWCFLSSWLWRINDVIVMKISSLTLGSPEMRAKHLLVLSNVFLLLLNWSFQRKMDEVAWVFIWIVARKFDMGGVWVFKKSFAMVEFIKYQNKLWWILDAYAYLLTYPWLMAVSQLMCCYQKTTKEQLEPLSKVKLDTNCS